MENNALHFKADMQLLRNPDLFFSQIDEDLVMMDEAQGCYFSLNAIGKDIWTILETPTSYADLLSALMKIYDVDEAQCQQDVEAFLAELLKNNLVHRV